MERSPRATSHLKKGRSGWLKTLANLDLDKTTRWLTLGLLFLKCSYSLHALIASFRN
jgi:hypothetical protein